MTHRTILAASTLLLAFGCAKPESTTTTTTPSATAAGTEAPTATEKTTAAADPAPKATQSAPPPATPPASPAGAAAMDCSTPKKTIESQYQGIKSGAPLDAMKSCFTARQKDKITAEMLASAKAQVGKMSFDELYASEEASADGVKVKMKNGRTLTTLVKDGAAWKADTLWFK